jgi:hypothetical protein
MNEESDKIWLGTQQTARGRCGCGVLAAPERADIQNIYTKLSEAHHEKLTGRREADDRFYDQPET